jgi:hypothetical protein
LQLLDIRLGREAKRHIESHGLGPQHIACIPAAAGGPKGLALLPFDRLFAREWLPRITRLELIGASIGAWRAAALAQPDALAALDRLQHAYVREQNYSDRPSPSQVAAVCRAVARAVTNGEPLQARDGIALSVITSRASGSLVRGSRAAFARAALDNTLARSRLAAHLRRVVFQAGERSELSSADAFGYECVPLNEHNIEDALLASGSIPLICDPVREIAGAPLGDYWDGGLIDYHLMLPYDSVPGLVLYPHFVPWVTPGWLDKGLRWRARPRQHEWLAKVILIAPSAAMLACMPKGKLPDRQDFHRYGSDHAGRIAAWERAIAESQRFAEAAMRWLESPDLSVARPL